MTKLTAENWRKEFDKLWKAKKLNDYLNGHKRLEIKSFISFLLKAHTKDLAGEKRKYIANGGIPNDIYNYGNGEKAGRNQHRQQVLEKGKLWEK